MLGHRFDGRARDRIRARSGSDGERIQISFGVLTPRVE